MASYATEQRQGPTEDRYCSDLHEPAGETELEVKHQARYQDMAVYDIYSFSPDVWV